MAENKDITDIDAVTEKDLEYGVIEKKKEGRKRSI